MATTQSTNEAIATFVRDTELAHQIVHGGDTSQVQTDGGLVDTYAKTVKDLRDAGAEAIADLDVSVNQEADGVLAGAVAARDAAAASATQAENEAMSAETAVGLAFAEATTAQAARTGAEAARDAAQLSAGVYATTAAGLAATTSGRYFSVPSADSSEYLILYLNNTGAAVEVKRYPAAAAIDALSLLTAKRAPPGYAWAVVDSLGRAAGGFLNDGTFRVQRLDVESTVEYDPPGGYVWALLDSLGQSPLGVSADGVTHSASMQLNRLNGISARRLQLGAFSGTYNAEINHILAYGQSLSVGTSGSPALTHQQAYNSLTFDATMSAFKPLTEPAYGGLAGTETTASGAAEHVVELIRDEAGISYQDHSYQILGSTAGEGGYTITGLEKGGAIYPRIPAQIAAAKSIADSLGKLYALQAVTWIQGESDYNEGTSRTAYKTKLLQMQANIEADAKAITGQTGNVPLITYQVASHKQRPATYPVIALAQLDAVVEGTNVYGACPMYIFDYVADNVHMPARSYKRLGAYFGLVYKRVVIDQQPWDVLRPISKTVRGAYVYIKFNVPVRPLKWDTTQVLKNTNYGFTVLDSGGAEITQIEEPVIINADTVKLHLASTPAAGVKIQYAFYGSGVTGRINGPRGNLRDSQGDQLIFKGPDNSEERLDNWCWIFEEII